MNHPVVLSRATAIDTFLLSEDGAVYNLIARRRYKWFGKRDVCMVPTPELRSRFRDQTRDPNTEDTESAEDAER